MTVSDEAAKDTFKFVFVVFFIWINVLISTGYASVEALTFILGVLISMMHLEMRE